MIFLFEIKVAKQKMLFLKFMVSNITNIFSNQDTFEASREGFY